MCENPARDFLAYVLANIHIEVGVWVALAEEELEGSGSRDKSACAALERAELEGVGEVAGKKGVHIAGASEVGLDCGICCSTGEGDADDSRGRVAGIEDDIEEQVVGEDFVNKLV